jgi:hypothetical protein
LPRTGATRKIQKSALRERYRHLASTSKPRGKSLAPAGR